MRLSALFNSFAIKVVIPVFAAVAAASFAVIGLLLWSSQEADRVAMERQERLMQLVISRMQESIAYQQESVTVWDDAVEYVRAGKDLEWIDDNLGSWMHTYFGHDAAYILDSKNELVAGFSANARTASDGFAALARSITPLLEAMRKKMRAGDYCSHSICR